MQFEPSWHRAMCHEGQCLVGIVPHACCDVWEYLRFVFLGSDSARQDTCYLAFLVMIYMRWLHMGQVWFCRKLNLIEATVSITYCNLKHCSMLMVCSACISVLGQFGCSP